MRAHRPLRNRILTRQSDRRWIWPQALLLCVLVADCEPPVGTRARFPANPTASGVRRDTRSTFASSGRPGPRGTASLDSLDRAITRLVGYVDTIAVVPTLQALLQYAHRRFGIREFADARARYDRATSRAGERVFRRIVDRNNVVDPNDLTRLSTMDVMVSAALYCDVRPLPPDFRDRLDSGRSSGRYDLTHVLLSLELLRENRCTDIVPRGYEDSVAAEVAALVASSGPPTDLEIESEALLSLAGCDHLLHPGFIARVLSAQRADGGFSATGQAADTSEYHTSGLALWVLLSSRYPAAPPAPLIDPR